LQIFINCRIQSKLFRSFKWSRQSQSISVICWHCEFDFLFGVRVQLSNF
jgi:hypothetical protein